MIQMKLNSLREELIRHHIAWSVINAQKGLFLACARARQQLNVLDRKDWQHVHVTMDTFKADLSDCRYEIAYCSMMIEYYESFDDADADLEYDVEDDDTYVN